jgi:hypothetical protein
MVGLVDLVILLGWISWMFSAFLFHFGPRVLGLISGIISSSSVSES